jgi:flagellar biosynthesis protein FliR
VLGAVLLPAAETLVAAPMDASWSSAAWAGMSEVLTGGVLGWSAALIVAGARLAGDLVAAQSGLSAAAFFDPETREELTPLGQLYGWIALAAFLALDGPLALVRALAESYRAVPAGQLLSSHESASLALAQVGRALELALRAAAPAALALALAGIVMGWLGRAAPSLSSIALALPIRVLLGIILVFLSLAVLAVTLSDGWSTLL